MFDFANLEVSQATAWCELPELAPKARLLLKLATDDNPSYFNAMLRKSGGRVRRMVRTDRMTVEDSAQNRDEDRVLFPKHVFVKWEGVLDTNDQPVEPTRDNVVEFFTKLPAWLFDRVRNFASTPERFLDYEDATPDPVELAEN
jgi:hypothetical protein